MFRFGSRAGEFASVVRLRVYKPEAEGKPTVCNIALCNMRDEV
jgi:hypothetical protein